MGLDISFFYVEPGPESLPEPALKTYLIDLFEAPDTLLETGAFGDSMEALEIAGFLPSFVKSHRLVFSSTREWTSQMMGLTEEERTATMDEMAEAALAGLMGEDDTTEEEEKADIVFDPSEAFAWSDLWLTLLDDDEIWEDDELRQSWLPLTNQSLERVVQDLQTLKLQAQSAQQHGLSLRMISQWD